MDNLSGGDRGDSLSGRSGRDTLYGSKGNDKLRGGKGNDKLRGGVGNDTIRGGIVKDRLIGGQGADVYVFNTSDKINIGGIHQDVIVGFQPNQDKIDLSRIDAKTKSAGNQAFKFIGKELFSGKGGELRYALGRRGATVSGDLNGDKRNDFQILVEEVNQLNVTSFLLERPELMASNTCLKSFIVSGR